MDPNLLPNELRNKESKEQSRLKNQPVGFGVELNLPARLPDRQAGKAGLPKNGKKKSWLADLFGKPVSPIVNYKTEKRPAPQFQPSPLQSFEPKPKNKSASAPKPARAGDSWPEIFKGMFNLGRKKRVDFRLASFKNGKHEPVAPMSAFKPAGAPAPILKAGQPLFSAPKKDSAAAHNAPAASKNHHATPGKPAFVSNDLRRGKPAYHGAPKRAKPSGFSVNLMPQELAQRMASGRTGMFRSLIIAIIAPVLIIAVGRGAVFLLQNDLESRLAAKKTELGGLQRQIGDFLLRAKANNQVADRVMAIKKLMDEKIIWSNFFSYLEKYTLDGVYFDGLTADTSGVMTLPGVADDYDLLARQLAVLRDADDFVKDVKLTNAHLISEGRAGVVGVGFQLRLTLQDNVFKKSGSLK